MSAKKEEKELKKAKKIIAQQTYNDARQLTMK